MGVLFNVYCIRPEDAPRLTLREMLEQLVAADVVEGTVVQGPALHVGRRQTEGRLVSPAHATFVYERESVPFRAFPSAQEATARLDEHDECVVSVSAHARAFRREPSHFYDEPASLGIYRVKRGHRLVVGEREDMSDLLDEFPELAMEAKSTPRFDGIVHEWFWLHGKNAPLEEDFLGSKLHRAIQSMWPGVIVHADEWL